MYKIIVDYMLTRHFWYSFLFFFLISTTFFKETVNSKKKYIFFFFYDFLISLKISLPQILQQAHNVTNDEKKLKQSAVQFLPDFRSIPSWEMLIYGSYKWSNWPIICKSLCEHSFKHLNNNFLLFSASLQCVTIIYSK
jgi:hypothetical protein